jgi:hypothetical protein
LPADAISQHLVAIGRVTYATHNKPRHSAEMRGVRETCTFGVNGERIIEVDVKVLREWRVWSI